MFCYSCFLDWSEEAVSSAEILRMIYQGRFLHGNVTLAGMSENNTSVWSLKGIRPMLFPHLIV